MDATTTITLPLPPDTLMILLVLFGLGLASYVIFAVLPKSDNPPRNNPIDRLATSLGFRLTGSFEAMLLFLVICVYAVVFAFAAIISLRALGGILLVANTDVTAPTQPRAGLAFGTLLAAILGAPFIIWRSWIAAKQTAVAEESLFNDKINAAAQDLAARRQVTKAVAPGGSYEKHQDFWEDDLVTRAAAIDRLEGLALEAMARGDYPPAQRIARMLSIYLQELSRAYPPQNRSQNLASGDIRTWAGTLTPIRPDMHRAAQSLGRINPKDKAQRAAFGPANIDLRRCNLQGFDLSSLEFSGALLAFANLCNSSLSQSKIQSADFDGANLTNCNLSNVEVSGMTFRHTDFGFAIFSGSAFRHCTFQSCQFSGSAFNNSSFIGCFFERAWFGSTSFGAAPIALSDFSGSAIREASPTTIGALSSVAESFFTDGTSKRSFEILVRQLKGTIGEHFNPTWPTHWSEERLSIEANELGESDFLTQWRAFAASLDPPVAIAPDYGRPPP
ncbi:pentapeptide repeat-containing protein [Rhodobacteraceae bacterium N5(2021)]|uniref:Pentapeptide repeat-containing protein n=1 Tax=Gymnodinialimonas phycosphaerae TaxID=2841589 RepID=A0A975TW15_9RHOB|nr:pentapeptide repeat-containing protein [Gymnodinialimonas phycosphaerae]MBY4895120.1 pentapeptide repeat-containing protein [Gymnodinialimonas phycosphaerae]